MRRTLTRLSIGTAALLLAAAAATSAFAASSAHGRFFGPRGGSLLLGGGPGHGFGMMMGPAGFRFGFGFGGPGFGGRHGGGILAADVLTPAASFLGISVSTLESDLSSGKTLAQEAAAKGKTASDLIDAIVAAEKKVLDAEVAAGWITSSQESALVGAITKAVTNLVNNGPPVVGVGKGSGLLQTAASYLGLSVSDLGSALQSGKTLADEAKAQGKTVDGLVQALLAPLKSRLDQRVSAGDITQAQENAILANETTRLTNLVNGTKPSGTVRMNGLRLALLRAFLHR
jgi:phage FluMu protein gp41